MELEVISKDKNMLEFYIKGERHTITSLLKSRLDSDSSVEFASYALDHPLANTARFVVRTNSRKAPKEAIADACEKIEKELGEFSDKVKKLKI